jgi:hypothetical protein
VWPAVSVKHLKVCELGDVYADVTEGAVLDSSVYEFGSSWEIKATPSNGGGHVEMVWVHDFRGGLKANLLGSISRRAGKRLFGWDARHVLKRLEKDV